MEAMNVWPALGKYLFLPLGVLGLGLFLFVAHVQARQWQQHCASHCRGLGLVSDAQFVLPPLVVPACRCRAAGGAR